MKANSDTRPERFTKSRGKTFFNFNIVEKQIEEDDGSKRTIFDYEYVEVEGESRALLISAIIRDRYSVDDEIALINNYSLGTPTGIDAYNEYQNYRSSVKLIVG